MKKEFIPYEQALALKELGFDEPCLAVYQNPDFLLIHNLLDSGWDKEEMIDVTNHKYASNGFVTAPLYQQAFRWFREKFRLEEIIQRMPPEVYGKGKGNIKNYLVYIWAENLNPRGQGTLHFDTYEEAELECINKLIEIVKNKK